jgi:hypothetical protein
LRVAEERRMNAFKAVSKKGEVATRKSEHGYTHAAFINFSGTFSDVCAGKRREHTYIVGDRALWVLWSSSLVLIEKAVARHRSTHKWELTHGVTMVYEIVEVQ